MSGDLLTDRAVGCLAGAAVGDALGGATEGWESHEIEAHFGGWVTGIVESIRRTKKVEKAFSPFHKGDGHVTDDTLMTRVLVRAYDVKRDHLDAYDVEALIVPAIVDEKTWVPELDREDLLYHRLFLAEKWLVLKLRYGHADPRDAGVGNIVNCGAAMYIAPVGIANAGDPRRRLRRGARPDRARTSRATGARPPACSRPPSRRRCGSRRRRTRSSRRACGSRRTARARRSRRWRRRREARRLARRRPRRAAAGVRAVRLGRRALCHASAERAHPEPAARDRGAADRARAARRDRRRLRGDGARRRQLRARLRLDRLDGRRARGSARQPAPARLGRRRLSGEQDRRRGGGQDDGRRRGGDLRARHAAAPGAGAGARGALGR